MGGGSPVSAGCAGAVVDGAAGASAALGWSTGGEYPAAPPVPSSPLVRCAIDDCGAPSVKMSARAEATISLVCNEGI
jgi:hypothetical protein